VAHELHVVRLIGAVADLTALLKDQGVPGAFIGGLAANLLGRPRITKDVDAVVLLGDLKLESFLAAGARFGFAPRINDAAKFATKNRVLLLIHEPSKTDVDISLGILPFEQESVDRASIITVAGISFPLVSPEDLIVMKALARRARDVADIEAVLDVQPEVDLERVRYWVSEFATVLEAPDILDDLERILAWKRHHSLKE
jgi:predicted nucleotidyltransferase